MVSSRIKLDGRPINDTEPVRIACLGGPRTGKTAFILKLAEGTFRDTYYPLRKTIPILFTYSATDFYLRVFLSEANPKESLQASLACTDLLLSPVISDSLVRASVRKPTPTALAEKGVAVIANKYYASYRDAESGELKVTPILCELIDTPAFNTSQFVPFLEASLYAKLSKDILRNLADEPRQPVNTEPLLVASGAGELNGTVDGYFFFYSAVPSVQPPNYGEEPSTQNAPLQTSLSFFPAMKAGLDEAWSEYYTYRTRWEQGKEKDMFSLKSALLNVFDRTGQLKQDIPKGKLLATSLDPANPQCPPPIWIICTHKNLPLASPKLVNDGKELAQQWRCGFVALDVTEDVDVMISLMVREVSERKALQKQRRSR